MRREMPPNHEPQITPKIDNLILIDRSVDNLTPMMIQLTYEGLVDEYLGIKYSLLIHFSIISIHSFNNNKKNIESKKLKLS